MIKTASFASLGLLLWASCSKLSGMPCGNTYRIRTLALWVMLLHAWNLGPAAMPSWAEQPDSEQAQAESEDARSSKLVVCATTPTLGALARIIGADDIVLHVLSAPDEDPHAVGPNNEFRDALATADVYIRNGVGLEGGWTPARGGQKRSSAILPGGIGYIDAGHAATLRDVPSSEFPPMAGSAHLLGNPHYLLDPLNAVKVARFLEARFRSLRPELSRDFRARRELFESRVTDALIGSQLASRYRVDSLAVLFERGELRRFLESQEQLNLLGGWLGRMLPHENKRVVADSQVWTYFLKRFGLRIGGYLDPIPGKPGHIAHLRELASVAKDRGVKALVASVYGQNLRHIEFATTAGVKTAILEHETGRLPNTQDYIEMIGANVTRLLAALEDTGGPEIDEESEARPLPQLPPSELEPNRPNRIPNVPELAPMPEAPRTPTGEPEPASEPGDENNEAGATATQQPLEDVDTDPEQGANGNAVGEPVEPVENVQPTQAATAETDVEEETQPSQQRPEESTSTEGEEPNAAASDTPTKKLQEEAAEPSKPEASAEQAEDAAPTAAPSPQTQPDSTKDSSPQPETNHDKAPSESPEAEPAAPQPEEEDEQPRVKPRRGVLFL